VTSNYSPSLQAAYVAHYWKLDLWAERGAKAGFSKAIESRDLIADDDLIRTEFYNDWLRPLDLFYLTGAALRLSDSHIGFFGIHRPHRSGAFERRDKERVAQLVPHVQRALQLRQRLAGVALERHAALDALERVGGAVLVVARDGRVLYANAAAEMLLRDGDAIAMSSGRLAAIDHAAALRLGLLIRSASDTAAGAEGSAGGGVALLREDRLPLTLLAAPFPPARDGFGAPLPAAILFIRDPEQEHMSQPLLQDLFALTPAEAAIAAALGAGKSVEDIARTCHISLNTARTHLKHIFAKTNTRRQAELVSLLVRSVAALRSTS
jgi:DNA-binding CsgD family transcriptional regulator/PAS domain-containing protein